MVHVHRPVWPPATVPGVARGVVLTLLAATAGAQQMQELSLRNVPPDLIQADAPAQPDATREQGRVVQPLYSQQTQVQSRLPVDLGEAGAANGPAAGSVGTESAPPIVAPTVSTGTPAARAAQAARLSGDRIGPIRHASRPAAAGIERAVFSREPVRVSLPVGQERLVTLPSTAALHVPTDIEQVARIEVIDRTMYVTALVPFQPLRIVAELIDSGQQLPLDLVAHAGTPSAVAELEIFVVESRRAAAAESDLAGAGPEAEALPAAPDMVQLTRHAARQLYAPRRLAWATPGVTQVAVATAPVSGLIRGVDVELLPLGQWRAGPLYVTALRLTNRSRYPLEVPLEQVRGRWIAATAQHGRVGPGGTETDTTALYLVCDRSFEACL